VARVGKTCSPFANRKQELKKTNKRNKKMKKRVMNKWVKALRSGEYRQCKGSMVETNGKGDKFCCLGVLTNIYVEENGMKGFTYLEKEGWKYCTGNNDKGNGLLNEKVREWAGLNSNNGELENGTDLASLNDGGKSFNTIAKVIEKNWEKL